MGLLSSGVSFLKVKQRQKLKLAGLSFLVWLVAMLQCERLEMKVLLVREQRFGL